MSVTWIGIYLLLLCVVIGGVNSVAPSPCYIVTIGGAYNQSQNGTYEYRDGDPKCNGRFIYGRTDNVTMYMYYQDGYWVVYDVFCNDTGVTRGYLRCHDDDTYPIEVDQSWQEQLSDGWYYNYDLELDCDKFSTISTTEIIILSTVFGGVLLALVVAVLIDYKKGDCWCKQKDQNVIEAADDLDGHTTGTVTNTYNPSDMQDNVTSNSHNSGSLYETFRQTYYEIHGAETPESRPTPSQPNPEPHNVLTTDTTTNQNDVNIRDHVMEQNVSPAPPPSYHDVTSDVGMTLYKTTAPPSYDNFAQDLDDEDKTSVSNHYGGINIFNDSSIADLPPPPPYVYQNSVETSSGDL